MAMGGRHSLPTLELHSHKLTADRIYNVTVYYMSYVSHDVHYVLSGAYSYMFTAPGTYYYWSNYVDEYETIYMRGTIYVGDRPSEDLPITVTVNGFESEYNIGGKLVFNDVHVECGD